MRSEIYILTIIIAQIILMKLYNMTYLDIFSLIKNVVFGIIILAVFIKSKKGDLLWKMRKFHKKFFVLLLIPFVYILQYMFMPTYIGQDIVAFPLTGPYHLTTNLQKLQNDKTRLDMLTFSHIKLSDPKWNFWYEYFHFLYGDDTWYLCMNRPGKHDKKINVLLYSTNIKNGDHNMHLQTTIPVSDYKSSNINNIIISEIRNKDIIYTLTSDLNRKRKTLFIKTGNITISIKAKPEMFDSYMGGSLADYYVPNGIKYLSKILGKNIGVTDYKPYEYMNDQHQLSLGEITINNITKNGNIWYDVYVGNGNYFMTNYIWTMHYSKNWYIFILFYNDYPYTDALGVSFFFDRNTNKSIEISNIYNEGTNFGKIMSGTKSSINTYGTKLCDKTMKYSVTYSSPKINCSIDSISLFKALDGFPLYKRLSPGHYGKKEEIQQLMEQMQYDEFAGESMVTIEYNGKKYIEQSRTVVDGVSWKNGRSGPVGYKKRNESFFKKPFYVEHTDRDKLNGKL